MPSTNTSLRYNTITLSFNASCKKVGVFQSKGVFFNTKEWGHKAMTVFELHVYPFMNRNSEEKFFTGKLKKWYKKKQKKKQYLKRRLKMNKNFFRRFRISFWILHCDRSSEEFNIQHNIGLVLVGHPRRWLPSVHLQKAEVTMLVTSDCSRISIFETKSLQGGCSGKNTKEVTSDDNDRWPPTT